jgi:hypothetical protein
MKTFHVIASAAKQSSPSAGEMRGWIASSPMAPRNDGKHATARLLQGLIAVGALLALAACMPQHPQSAQRQSPQQNGAQPVVYASDDHACGARAQSRMGMYDRPDTFPISDQERHDAYLALYSSCMRERNWQVAGPARAPGSDVAQLANLAPAAGGGKPPANSITAGNSVISTSSVPGATVIVIGGGKDQASQLAALNPSSGGAYPPNATVLLVQPQAATPMMPARAPTMPAAALPVAVPLPAPATAKAVMPAPVQQQAYQSAPTPPTSAPAPPSAAEAQIANQELENVLEK